MKKGRVSFLASGKEDAVGSNVSFSGALKKQVVVI